jgi:transcriptional regulator with XRE-family HTH domain/KaiC/GvpD/RAD55 family RecA-like ATPase
MYSKKISVSSGVSQFDNLLGGLLIGDNVIWYDDAGSLASLFYLNFIRESQQQQKAIIYVSFDRSPRALIEELGPLAEGRHLTILDCFTYGKGDGSGVFRQFYDKDADQWPCKILKVEDPARPAGVMEAIYSLHQTLEGDVRLVFESLTGMQELWGGEEQILKFYSRSCPRLYELDTIAYWVIEKGAHSNRLRANINHIAQVAVELNLSRGKSSLTILKADKRNPAILDKPQGYWTSGLEANFEGAQGTARRSDLGLRLKDLRKKKGLSQKDLAGFVGVTPSTISQIESSTIYPSIPALFKIGEVLGVEISAFFQSPSRSGKPVFSGEGVVVNFPDLPKGSIQGRQLSPLDFDGKAEPYLLEIEPNKKLPAHFFTHKGEELGYLLEGELKTVINNNAYSVKAGETIYLKADNPAEWTNPGPDTARLLWVKIK